MPYEPLHHKYRPQTFKDLVGQETIALTLSNALKQEKIAPAYLFTGPRGTGKTSSARILAKSLNCLASDRPTPDPCGKCEACLAIAKGSALDVMEIDAASNTGVDNIREIIERSRFAPVQCRYKIYAIDECHMLSTAAFNALLKTLEEPPPKVVFILATTDPQRVLSTIISRCQRFDYRRIPLPEMINHLKYIAREENIAIVDEAIALISQIANGGLRDAESLLDQLSLLPEEISVAKVWDLVGAVPEKDLLILLQAINNNDSLKILQQCRSLLDRGREPMIVLQNLASFYLNLLIAKTAPQNTNMVAVTETCWQQLCTEATNWDTALILRGQQQLKAAETQLRHTTQPRLWLEVTLLGLLTNAPLNTEISVTVDESRPKANQIANEARVDTIPTAIQESNQISNRLSQASKQASYSVTTQTPIQNNTVNPEIINLDNINTINSAIPVPTPISPNLDIDKNGENINVMNVIEVPAASQLNTEQAKQSSPANSVSASSSPTTAPSNIVEPEHKILTPNPTVATTLATTATVNEVANKKENNQENNREIWSKVVSCLQPPTTQALLKQQCYLVEFDGSSAIVGISSAKLQKLNQGKVPNIEAAFAQVCQRKIKVQLEVASGKESSVKNPAPPRDSRPLHVSQPTPDTNPDSSSPPKPDTTVKISEKISEVKKSDFSVSNLEVQKFKSKIDSAKAAPLTNHSQSITEQVSPLPSLPPIAPRTTDVITPVSPANIPTNTPLLPTEQNLRAPEAKGVVRNQIDNPDNYLQQAISNLTHCFEGELVQMNDSQAEFFEDFEEEEIEEEEIEEILELPEANEHYRDRPNIEDYNDEW